MNEDRHDRMYFNSAGEEMCRVRRGERFRKPRDWTAKLVPSADAQEVETLRLVDESANVTAF